jgi:hypothetical protein
MYMYQSIWNWCRHTPKRAFLVLLTNLAIFTKI